MSESNSYSDLWKYDDNDDSDQIQETTATSKRLENSISGLKKKKIDDSEVLEFFYSSKKKRKCSLYKVKKYDEENSQNEEEEEPEQVDQVQKRQSIVINLIDDDEEEGQEKQELNATPVQNGSGQTVVGQRDVENVNGGQMSKIMKELIALKSDFQQIQEQENSAKEEEQEVNFVDTQEDQEVVQETDSRNNGIVQIQQEEGSEPKEISKRVEIECPQGKICTKFYPSQKLKEVFSQFEEQAVQKGWAIKGSQFEYQYFGSNIDRWQTLTDIGFRNGGTLTASLKEVEESLMRLKVQCQRGMLLEFKMGASSNFSNLFEKCREAALQKNWITENTKLIFQFDGDTLEESSTPQDLDLEDEDQLEVLFKS